MKKIADISHHQGVINWVKASQELELVIIRTKYGSNLTDRYYKANVAGVRANKIPYGLYHYAQFVSVSDAIKEAQDFLATATKEARFLVLDVEEQTCPSVEILQKASQAFIDHCKLAGYKVGLYTGNHFYKPYGMAKVKADFLWIPRYGNNEPVIPCDIWQYTDTGKLAGVTGYVDLNKLIGNKPLSWFIDEQPVGPSKVYRLVTGTFSSKASVEKAQANLKKYFKVVYIKQEGDVYRLVTGTFANKADAEKGMKIIKTEFGYVVYLKEV
ncbi:GH25 family lysozyme [Bacillus massiliigorillae]|uniref:GH25 family lysozyme n=1 Tax=Bacillus massiliigorillae TaxID=1243664 RepID=UPI00039CB525|nr:GH25 family lysozyme [Bacillus massiliigorillae]